MYMYISAIVTAILLTLVIPVLAVALIFMLLDINTNTGIYDSTQGGDSVYYQHLFWVFGHPEVYIIILPGMGIVSTVLMDYSHTSLAGHTSLILAMYCIGIVGCYVWAHHMYTSGMDITSR